MLDKALHVWLWSNTAKMNHIKIWYLSSKCQKNKFLKWFALAMSDKQLEL